MSSVPPAPSGMMWSSSSANPSHRPRHGPHPTQRPPWSEKTYSRSFRDAVVDPRDPRRVPRQARPHPHLGQPSRRTFTPSAMMARHSGHNRADTRSPRIARSRITSNQAEQTHDHAHRTITHDHDHTASLMITWSPRIMMAEYPNTTPEQQSHGLAHSATATVNGSSPHPTTPVRNAQVNPSGTYATRTTPGHHRPPGTYPQGISPTPWVMHPPQGTYPWVFRYTPRPCTHGGAEKQPPRDQPPCPMNEGLT